MKVNVLLVMIFSMFTISCTESNYGRNIISVDECHKRGIAYYKEIGSYPKLSSTGQKAEEAVSEKCARTTGAFGPF